MNLVQSSSTTQSPVTVSHGHRLLQVGAGLLLVTSLQGFLIPALASPRIALSAHTLAVFQSLLFLALGLVWPRLRLSTILSRIAWWCLVFSGLSILAAYVMAAFWGAGSETLRFAAAGFHGTPGQEAAIGAAALASAPTGLIALCLVLWGLRVRQSR